MREESAISVTAAHCCRIISAPAEKGRKAKVIATAGSVSSQPCYGEEVCWPRLSPLPGLRRECVCVRLSRFISLCAYESGVLVGALVRCLSRLVSRTVSGTHARTYAACSDRVRSWFALMHFAFW